MWADRPIGGSGSAAGAGSPTFEGAPFVFAHSAPHTGILTTFKCPLEARVDDRAAAADALRFLDLEQRRARVSHGEEQLRVLVQAGSTITPVHSSRSTPFRGTPDLVKIFTRRPKAKGPCGAPRSTSLRLSR